MHICIYMNWLQDFDFASTRAIEIVSDEQAVTVVEYNVAEEEDPVALEKVGGVVDRYSSVDTSVLALLNDNTTYNRTSIVRWIVDR